MEKEKEKAQCLFGTPQISMTCTL